MVTSLPDPSTVTCCAYELGVLSDLQVMYNCEDITLSWDSTTVNGDHINEICISYTQIKQLQTLKALHILRLVYRI